MYALVGAGQRVCSIRITNRDAACAGGQSAASHRHKAMNSRGSCLVAAASSTSQHGPSQQQNPLQHHQEDLHLQQHSHQVSPQASLATSESYQHHSHAERCTSTTLASAAAFYTPPGATGRTAVTDHSFSNGTGTSISTALTPGEVPSTSVDSSSLGSASSSDAIGCSVASSSSSSHGIDAATSSRRGSSSSSSTASSGADTSKKPPAVAAQQLSNGQDMRGGRGPKQKAAVATEASSSSEGTSNRKGKGSGGSSNCKQHDGQMLRSKHSSSSSKRARVPDELGASKLLTKYIAQASSWQGLQKLLQKHHGRMNHIHAAALLSTTSKLVQYHQLQPQQQQEFAAFYVDALQLAYSQAQCAAGPRELSSMLWAVARVGLHPGEDWLAAYLAAVQPQLQAMNAQDVGLLVWSLARFRLHPQSSFCAALEAATQQQLVCTVSSGDLRSSSSSSSSNGSSGADGGSSRSQPNSSGLDAQGFSNVLWGFAVLDLHPGQPWLSAAVAAGEQLLRGRHFEPQGIAVMLWSLAKFGCRPQQLWLHGAADAAARQFHAFKPAELSMLCHALARLHYQPQQQHAPQQHTHTSEQQQQQQAGQKPAVQQAHSQQQQEQQQEQQQQRLLAQIQSVSWTQLHSLHFSEAANMLWALGVMGQSVPPDWVEGALQHLQATLHDADAKALSSACYGLAKLRHKGSDAWWEAVWQHVPHLMGVASFASIAAPSEGLSAGSASSSSSSGTWGCAVSAAAMSQSQATFMWSLAKLKAVPPADVASSLFAASEQLLQQQAVNAAELMGISMAAAMLQLQPPVSWLTATEGMFEVLLLHSCAAQHSSTTSVSAPQQQAECEALLELLQRLVVLQEQQQQQGSSEGLQKPASLQQQQQGSSEGMQKPASLQQQQQQGSSEGMQKPASLQQQQQQGSSEGMQKPVSLQEQQQQQGSSGIVLMHASLQMPAMQPKEVANVVFSFARLRHVPSYALVSALQAYIQQRGHGFVAADWEQLRRAVQSMHGQLQQRQTTAAAAGDEATPVAPVCACDSGNSSSSSSDAVFSHSCPPVRHEAALELQHLGGMSGGINASADVDALRSPLQPIAGDLAADLVQQQRQQPQQQQQLPSLGSLESICQQQEQQQEQQQQAYLEGVVDDGFMAGALFSERELQSEDMLLVGKYLQLPLRSHHGGSSSNASTRVSGFSSADGNAVALGSERHRRRKVALVHYHAVADGLSVATG